jgi:uncharacterized protein YndB with AHSA1/START domain
MMNENPQEVKPINKTNKILLGIFVPNITAMIIVGFATLVFSKIGDRSEVMLFSTFVLLPLLMGIISAWFWKDINLRGLNYTGYSLINSALAILLSAVFLGEGFICLIIVSPLIMAFVITGAFIGRFIFLKRNNTLNVSAFSIFAFICLADVLSPHLYENMVSDKMIIKASTEEVWKHVVAYERIKEKNKFWLFQIGMPSPVQTTVDGYAEGAGRKCIFSNGYVFEEKMVVFQPNKDLTFDITHQPQDPEIMGHIDILKGQFLLKDNGDGTTTLTGNSWYRLYVFPVWYFDIWARSITRNVHLRVMDHIKNLSEKK